AIDTIVLRDADNLPVVPDSVYRQDGGMTFILSRDQLLSAARACVEKTDVAAAGLSVQDIRIGQRQILQLIDGCPEDQIAGDVNDTGTFTASDLVGIRNVLLQRADTFASNLTWRFVRADSSELELCPSIRNRDKNAGTTSILGIKLGDLQCNE
ncbi:MAG: hypothetical protein AAFR14_07190, partial [Bacteroidota bacterium]